MADRESRDQDQDFSPISCYIYRAKCQNEKNMVKTLDVQNVL